MTDKEKRKQQSAHQNFSVIGWLRDKAYDLVYIEGDFILQFTADFIRGPDPVREDRHLKRQINHWNGRGTKVQGSATPKPLTHDEKVIFAEILKRKPSEPQVTYWKRKKALLQTADKHDLIKQHIELKKEMAKRQTRQSTPKPEFQSVTQNYQKSATQKQDINCEHPSRLIEVLLFQSIGRVHQS